MAFSSVSQTLLVWVESSTSNYQDAVGSASSNERLACLHERLESKTSGPWIVVEPVKRLRAGTKVERGVVMIADPATKWATAAFSLVCG